MAIRAVVFDIGGVLELVDDDRWQDEWIARWEVRAGQPVGTVAGAPRRSDRSETGLREWLKAVLALSDDDADAMLGDFWDSYCGQLDPVMRDFVHELSSHHLVASLSNSADGARREDDRRFGFGGLFAIRVYSDEVGFEKPDPRIYRHTQSLIGVPAQEILFLDDREEAVAGAREVGWHAIRHLNAQDSIAGIRALIAAEL